MITNKCIFVQQKYIVPPEGKKWVMETTNDSWRAYKSCKKKKYYLAYNTDELRWQHCPKTLSRDTFTQLLAYWGNEKIQV